MLVVNLFAAPGSGKSTTAAGLFYKLKTTGINAELAGEYAKDCVWSQRYKTLQDQFYVFGKQHHRIFRLKDDVDVVVVDSPILLGLAYCQDYPECFRQSVKWAFDQYDNMNFLLTRVKPYNPKGRTQTEEQSNAKQLEIIDLLKEFNVDYRIYPGNDDGLNAIYDLVIQKIKKM